jgi:hypothetical protein
MIEITIAITTNNREFFVARACGAPENFGSSLFTVGNLVGCFGAV